MGLEIPIQTGEVADWPAVVASLATLQITPTLRMIDGQLAFPDETPSADWRELRVSLPGGMITVGRTSTGYRVVSWGTADPQLDRARNVLAYAIAHVTRGRVKHAERPLTAAEFAEQVGIRSA